MILKVRIWGIVWVWILMALQPNINLNLPYNGRSYPTTQPADSITLGTGRQCHPNLTWIYSFHNTQEPQLWVQVLTVYTNIFLVMYSVLKCWKHSTVHFSLAEEVTLSTKMRLDISVFGGKTLQKSKCFTCETHIHSFK
jgi:hypothetical protein